jgi:type III restriction enzyme
MPLSVDFPRDPFKILPPELRWYPGEEELTEEGAAKLMPPLVVKIRQGVHAWRESGYAGVSDTSRHLLLHWFTYPHVLDNGDGSARDFQYFFAQREAVESAVWLYEAERARDPYSLMRYDSTQRVSRNMFPEDWTRYVFKLATGAGKTKVLSLLMAWSYFHKLYEPASDLSTNFLMIAPNIIVLDRLRDDFDGLAIFRNDPVLPENGYGGRDWRNDFQLTVHIQDEVGPTSDMGNLFLTNVHRVYEGPLAASLEDDDLASYFLGPKPVGKTTARMIDLGDVVRELNDLVVLNDEAHHIHDDKLAWFKAIEDLSSRLIQKGSKLSAQFDVTATPKHSNGAIFVQTVCSYPLVEAIRQGVVKTPVLPDEASRSKLMERTSEYVEEQFADHIKLGYLEWKKLYDRLLPTGKKAILFVMTMETKDSDRVADYMEREFPDLAGAVLVIHTNRSGEVKEPGGKRDDKELELLRQASRNIDDPNSPYKVVVSVLMLREGWDVQNVVAMVGLRPFTAKAAILPEQTLGRGLRRMFRDSPDITEHVSVVGTQAFLDFVEGIRSEGVELDYVPMGTGTDHLGPLVVAVDHGNTDKDLDSLDIDLPILSPRIERQMKDLDEIDPHQLPSLHLPIRQFTPQQQREIVFRDLDTGEATWSTDLGEDVVPMPQALIAYLTMEVMRHLRLVGGKEILFGKMKAYVTEHLFDRSVDLNDLNAVRNLSETGTRNALREVFTNAINQLTVRHVGNTRIVDGIKLSNAKPHEVARRPYLLATKSIFDKVVCGNDDELKFATFLDRKATDVVSFVKNETRSGFLNMEYVKSSGMIAAYYPDFIVKTTDGTIWIIETKGQEDIDVMPKWKRLVEWCVDATAKDKEQRTFRPLYVLHTGFKAEPFTTFAQLVDRFVSAKPTR